MMLKLMLDRYLSYNGRFDIPAVEITKFYKSVENTSSTLDNNPHLYRSMVTYNSGCCYYNGKISHGQQLSDDDKTETENIDKLSSLIAPLRQPLYLFHGFEPGLKYNDDEWVIGERVKIPFHLSKTPVYYVAKGFSMHFYWYVNNLLKKKIYPDCYYISFWSALRTVFMRKYLFCYYDVNSNVSHISTDIRCPVDLFGFDDIHAMFQNEEFEYLTKKNEEFVLEDIVYKYSFMPPFINKFYIMRSI